MSFAHTHWYGLVPWMTILFLHCCFVLAGLVCLVERARWCLAEHLLPALPMFSLFFRILLHSIWWWYMSTFVWQVSENWLRRWGLPRAEWCPLLTTMAFFVLYITFYFPYGRLALRFPWACVKRWPPRSNILDVFLVVKSLRPGIVADTEPFL